MRQAGYGFAAGIIIGAVASSAVRALNDAEFSHSSPQHVFEESIGRLRDGPDGGAQQIRTVVKRATAILSDPSTGQISRATISKAMSDAGSFRIISDVSESRKDTTASTRLIKFTHPDCPGEIHVLFRSAPARSAPAHSTVLMIGRRYSGEIVRVELCECEGGDDSTWSTFSRIYY